MGLGRPTLKVGVGSAWGSLPPPTVGLCGSEGPPPPHSHLQEGTGCGGSAKDSGAPTEWQGLFGRWGYTVNETGQHPCPWGVYLQVEGERQETK